MGKPTGFMEYDRTPNGTVPPLERIRSYDEFHPPLDPAARRQQAARCMNCGVPFCQAAVDRRDFTIGCPLGNLIPEWNDLLYRGSEKFALERLLKTASFPEFTGRVCPALCEGSCTCGHYGDPVTVRENELAIIETAFAQGLMRPRPPKTRTGKRVAVVGSGPAGLAVADRLNRRGHTVFVYERDDRPGGLLMYGIPNMKLDKRVVERRVKLMEAEGVSFECGQDVTKDGLAGRLLAEYDAVVLCCGAKRPRDLAVPGREALGVHFAVDYLTAATKVVLSGGVSEISAAGKAVVVVGGGDTGNDCVGTAVRQGCASVVQLEMMPPAPDARSEQNPWPQWPRVLKTDYGQQEAAAVFGADPRVYCTTVESLTADAGGGLCSVRTVRLETKTVDGKRAMVPVDGSQRDLPCGLLLIAAGFLGCEHSAAEAFGAELDARGNLSTQPGIFHTGVPKLFAAGDMHRGQSLVVKAIAEGRACAREVDEALMGFTNL